MHQEQPNKLITREYIGGAATPPLYSLLLLAAIGLIVIELFKSTSE